MLFFVVIDSKRSRPIQFDIKESLTMISLGKIELTIRESRPDFCSDYSVEETQYLCSEPFALVTRGEHEKIGIIDGLISCSKYKNLVFYTLTIEHILTGHIDPY